MNKTKALIAVLAHVVVGILFMVAIWPALQGNNDGYMTKTAAVVIAELDPVLTSEPTSAPVSESTPEVSPEPASTPISVPDSEPTPSVTPESAPAPISELAPKAIPDSVKEAPVSNAKEDEKEGALYSVVDGNKLDAESYAGFKLFRNWCARCHGTYGQGMVGPDLAESLKIITEKEFFETVENGKSGTIGSMPAWKSNPKVIAGRDQIYAYLMARSDGAIGVVKPKKQK